MGIGKLKIAFFDSGVGGLTTLYACVKYLEKRFPFSIDYYYYGDNFRAPYGNLSTDAIFRYVEEAFFEFERLKIDAAVIACNTATAICAEILRKNYSFPIVGIEPALFPAMKIGGRVFVLATRATCRSEKFQELERSARSKYPDSRLKVIACERLAGEIERNIDNARARLSSFLPSGKPDRVVLGCTHYSYLKTEIEKFYDCTAIDGNEGVAKRLLEVVSTKTKWSAVVEKAKDALALNITRKSQGKELGKELFFETESNLTKTSTNFFKNESISGFFREKNPFLDEKTELKIKNRPLVTPIENSKEASRIFFLGKAKMVNKTKYEQTFAGK